MPRNERLYLRIIPDEPAMSLESFQEHLTRALAGSFEQALPPEAHPRGGFAVWIRCSDAKIEELVQLLARHGLRCAI